MPTYRFRVKYEHDPTSFWRDLIVGADRTLNECQTVLNHVVGLKQNHPVVLGTDQDYWDSNVQYNRLSEIEQSRGEMVRGGEAYDAGETPIGQMVRQLDVEEQDRVCYLFDYGDEWHFYAILKEITEDAPSDTEPAVVKETGEPEEQYPPPEEGWESLQQRGRRLTELRDRHAIDRRAARVRPSTPRLP